MSDLQTALPPPPGFVPVGSSDNPPSPAPAASAPQATPSLTMPVRSQGPAAPKGFVPYDAAPAANDGAPAKPAGYGLLDVPKEVVGGAVHGIGSLVRGAGDLSDTVTPTGSMEKAVDSVGLPRWLAHPGRTIGDAIGAPIQKAGDAITNSESDAAKTVKEAPLVEGKLTDPSSWRLGTGASSPMDWTLKGANLVGNLAPMLAGTEVTAARALTRAPGMTSDILAAVRAGRVAELAPEAQAVAANAATASSRAGLAAGAGAGGLQGAEDAAQGEAERIRQMAPADLEKLPAYGQMIARGMSPDDARASLADQVRSRAFATTLPIATAASGVSAAPLLQRTQGALASLVGESALKRAAAGAAIEAPLQGGIAVGQTAAQVAATNSVTGENRNPLEDSLATFGAGALPGGAFGAIGGLHRPGAMHPDAAPGSMADAVNAMPDAVTKPVKPQPDEPAPAAAAPARAVADTKPVNVAPPVAPSWVDPSTGEVGEVTPGHLAQSLAHQMVAQQGTDGSLRVNANALAQAWGVPVDQVKRARMAGQRMAQDIIAANERRALAGEPPVGFEPAAAGETPQGADATSPPARTFDDIGQDIDSTFDAAGKRLGEVAPAAEGAATEAPEQAPADDPGPAAAAAAAAPVEAPPPSTAGADEPGAPVSEPAADAVAPATAASDEPAAPPAEANVPDVPADVPGDALPGGGSPPPAAEPLTGAGAPASPAASPTQKVEGKQKAESLKAPAESTRVEPAPDITTQAARAAQNRRVQTPEGEMTGKAFVDKNVAAGFESVDSRRMGDKLQHQLVHADGTKKPLPAGLLPYAQEAIASRAKAAASTAKAPVSTESAENATQTAKNATETVKSATQAAKDAPVAAEHAQPGQEQVTPAAKIEAAAAEAAHSPHNDIPEPTDAQKEAGNYKKGHVLVHGMDISIENPRGSTRSGVGAGGKAWSHEMSDHYGYVRGTVGADGDHVDVYVGPKPESKRVFVVDQVHQQTGKFDEHKAMLGFANQRDAVRAYKSNFDPGWKVGPVRDLTVDQFKAWLKEGDTTKPVALAAPLPAVATKAAPAKRGGIATNGARVRVAGGKLQYVQGAKETLQAYFKPASLLDSYGGGKQRVEAFHWNDGNWHVDVRAAGPDGVTLKGPDGEMRSHATSPEPRQLVKVLGKPELAGKAAPAASKAAAKTAELLGAKVGDMVRTTRMGSEIQPGSTWRIESIGADGSVEVRNATGGMTSKFSGKELQREVNAGARFENVSRSEAASRDFSFAGENARTADHGRLEEAQHRERMGLDAVPDAHGNRIGSPEDTHAATGWHRGADGKWRFEIDDSKATIKGMGGGDRGAWVKAAKSEAGARLGDVLDHAELFKAYPEFEGVHVRIDPDMQALGSFSAAKDTVTIRDPSTYSDTADRQASSWTSVETKSDDPSMSLKSVLLHELQHAIQSQEGFARGGSSAEFAEPLRQRRDALLLRRETIELMQENARKVGDDARVAMLEGERQKVTEELASARLESDADVKSAASKQYKRLAGEVEARNTQTRLDMTPEERAATPPTETQDITRADQIVRFGGERGSARFEGPEPSPEQLDHAQRVTDVAREVTKAWKGEDVPRVQVVPTPEQLPHMAKVDPATGRPDASYKRARGMYDGKTVWLVASAHGDTPEGRAVLARTLAHEAVGHYGVDRVVARELGADAWGKIESTFARLESEKAGGKDLQSVLEDVRRRYGDVDATTFAREAIAVMAERGIRNSIMDRVVAAVQAFLRRVMPDMKIAPAELRQLLARSQEYLERGESYNERVSRQQAMAFSRDGWDEHFPDVVLGHPLGAVRDHADFAAAKAGDNTAALRLARDLVTKDFADRVKAQIPEGSKPTIVPVVAREATGDNRIPNMAAEVLAKRLGLEVDHGMTQMEKVGRGAGDAMHRLANQPTFEGKVEPGHDYVLLDDTLTQGGTLAQLKTHIEREGGNVVLATALTGKEYSRKLALDPSTLGQVRDKFGRIEGWWRRQFGHGFDGLTESEARTILTYDKGRLTPDGLRDGILARRIPGVGEVGEGAAGARPGTEAPGAGRGLTTGDAGTGEPTPKPKPEFSLDDRGEREEQGKPRKAFSSAASSMDALQESLPKLDEPVLKQAKDWLAGKVQDMKPAALGALQLRHVLELMEDSKQFPGAKRYADMHQRMDADRTRMINDTALETERWRKWAYEKGPAGWVGKLRPEAKTLARFIHDVTQLAVDPTDAYQKLLMQDSRGEFQPWTKELIKERTSALIGQMRGRPGDDKTAMMEEVKALRALPKREKAREARYPELKARWQEMPEEAREIFKMARDRYRTQADATEQALLGRIDALAVPENYKKSLADRIRFQFEASRVEGVYFPLSRFGDYWVAGTRGNGEQVFGMFESFAEAEKAERQMRAGGVEIEAHGLKDTEFKAKNAPSGTFVSDVIRTLDQAGAPEKVQDEIYQLFLQSLPEMSMRKHAIHRKNIAGFSDDAMRAFAKNGFHSAHQVARLDYGHRMEAALEGMTQRFEDNRAAGHLGGNTEMGLKTATTGDALLGELRRRHDWIMSPKDSKLANVAGSIGFAYYLSASPASALVNLTQGAQVTLPVLGARHGWPKALKELGSATKDAMRTFGNIHRVLRDDEERQAFRTLEERGTFSRTATHTLAGIAEGNDLTASPAWAKVMNTMGYLFHKSEVINREAAGIAAYRLAKGDGKSFDEAVRYADEIVNGTHFDFSNANRARFMQGNTAKVLTQFKSYSLGMSWVLYRNLYKAMKGETPEVRQLARRTLTGVLGMTGLLAGTMGLPIINLVRFGANAVHAVTGDDDTPWDFNTEFRSWLSDHLGSEAAKWVADGAIDRAGAQIGARTKLSDLWFRDPDKELEGRDAYYNLLETLAGPLGGMTKNFFVGSQMMGQGQTYRGIETMLPKFAKDGMKAVRYASQGVNNLRGDPIVTDVSKPEELVQALGFQPTRIAEQQRINSALMNYQQFIQDRRQSLMNGFAMATQGGDEDGRAQALQKIRSFNSKYPEIAIGVGNLQSSMRARAQKSAQAENGIMLNKKLGNRVKQEVGSFATPAG